MNEQYQCNCGLEHWKIFPDRIKCVDCGTEFCLPYDNNDGSEFNKNREFYRIQNTGLQNKNETIKEGV